MALSAHSNPLSNHERNKGPSKAQSIQPIDVTESWGLCHHLAYVVTYVARAAKDTTIAHKTSYQARLRALKQGEWYLLREILKEHACSNPSGYPQRSIVGSNPILPEAIAREWQLTPHLKETLFYIYTFQKLLCAFPQTRVVCLKQALTHLRAEIVHFKSFTPRPDQGGKQ